MYIPLEKLPEFLDNAEQKTLKDLSVAEMDLLAKHRPARFKEITDTVDAPVAPAADGEVPPATPRREMSVSTNGFRRNDGVGRRAFRNGFLVSGEDVKNPNEV